MLFNSLEFFAFFAIFYCVYLALFRAHKVQNLWLLVGSYLFYGWWDWRFLGLLLVSTVIDYAVGRRLHVTEDAPARKRLLMVSLASNLGILGFFKYFNFFTQSTIEAANALGLHASPVMLNIVLPVGVSFYTFQTMSYTIDVYRKRLEPSASLLDFAVFVAFFPQLVAGPIERAAHLLPQVARRRVIDAEAIHAGLFLIAYGYFQKVFVADNVAKVVNQVFGKHHEYSGADLVLAVVAFAIQIYCDFGGYSKIARGLAKLMGFELMVNFRLPYFALNPSDFWQRWHISLSSWLRDYLYISLGGNRGSALKTYRNLSLTMLLGGLWHGAAWNFVIWGAFHGAILVVYRAVGHRLEGLAGWLQVRDRAPLKIVRWAVMLALTLYGWLIFRASGWEQIVYFTTHASWATSAHSVTFLKTIVFYSWILVVTELTQHFSGNLLVVARWPLVVRTLAIAALIAITLALGERESMEFIYFQF